MIFMFLLPCVRLPHAETKHKLCHASLQLQSPDPGHFVTSSSSKHTSQQLHNYIVRFIINSLCTITLEDILQIMLQC